MHSGLNHIYRLVWDNVREAWMPVAEHCKSCGKGVARRAALTGKLSLLAVAVLPGVVNAYTAEVDNGMAVFDEVVSGGGIQNVNSGGTTTGSILSGTSIVSLATQNVYDGGIATGTIVNNFGIQNISSGGIATGTIVNGGGVQSVIMGGSASDTIVNDGGTQSLYAGFAFDTTVNSGGLLVVSAASYAYDAIVNSGGSLVVSAGNSFNPVINSGGTLQVDGGGAYGVKQKSGAILITNTDASVSGSNALGTFFVDAATHTTSNVLLENGGSLTVNAGGIANDTTVSSGGKLLVDAGGIALGVIQNGGAALNTSTDATVSGTNALGVFSIDAATGIASNVLLENGGLFNVNTGDTAYDTTVNTGGRVDVLEGGTVSDLTVNGGAGYIYTGSTLSGNVAVTSGGQLTVTAGAVTDGADMTLSDSGALYLDNTSAVSGSNTQYSMGAMTMDGGSVYFEQSGYADLTMTSLEGTGTFYMNTEVATLQSDTLTVTGEANGDFDVYIADTGVSPTSDDSLQMIQTGGGDAEFNLANNGGVVDVGTYQYHLVDNGNDTWSLSPTAPVDPVDPPVEPVEPPVEPVEPPVEPVEPPVEPVEPPVVPVEPVPPSEMTISPSTAAVLSMATADPLIFKAELDTVRGRLDQVRSFEHETSVWAQYNFNNFGVSSSAGAGYDMAINGLTLGMDKSVEAGDGVLTFGGFTSYSNSDMEFDRGGDGEVDSYSVGGYGSYMHNSGFYVDGVLKANRFAHDVNAQMNSGTRAYGNYDANGIGAHLQTGKYFWFDETYVAPYVGMSAFVSDSSNYTLSNGMKAQVDNQRSMIGEVGVQVGHNFEVNGSKIQPYFRAALAQEFIDSNDVKVNEDHFTNDLSGSRGIYQVGVNAKVTDTINVNVNASYSHGKQVDEPLTAHLGVSWSF